MLPVAPSAASDTSRDGVDEFEDDPLGAARERLARRRQAHGAAHAFVDRMADQLLDPRQHARRRGLGHAKPLRRRREVPGGLQFGHKAQVRQLQPAQDALCVIVEPYHDQNIMVAARIYI